MRLVVPGWAGNNWSKWVRKIVVARDGVAELLHADRLPDARTPVPAGSAPAAVPLDPVAWMNVKSLITWPDAAGCCPPAPSRFAESPGPARGTSRRSRSGSTGTTDGEAETAWRARAGELAAMAAERGALAGGPRHRGPARPTRWARSSPNPRPGTRAGISGTASMRSIARSVDSQ